MDPKFASSNLANGDGFLRAIKICSIPSFRGEITLSVPCIIVWHVKDPFKV
jgi:hypothetical protein